MMDEATTPQGKFSREEKQQLLDNLEIEIAHRTRRLQGELEDALEKFLIRQEGHISRIPRLVRAMPLREFRDKYKGDVKAALRGMQMEKLGATKEGEGPFGEIDKATRKRKWVASIEGDAQAGVGSMETESPRGTKNARTMNASPKKKAGSSTGPGTAQRARLQAVAVNRTPGTQSRTMGRPPSIASLSPQKLKPLILPHRPTSPTKLPGPGTNRHRPPSTNTFAPVLPKTPVFPGLGTARLPRRDENMLSVNGSPLANPYQLGLGWFAGVATGEDDRGDMDDDGHVNGPGTTGQLNGRSASRNKINIRRDPSSVFSTTHSHTRTTSQSSNDPSASGPQHTRTNSNTRQPGPSTDPRPMASAPSATSNPLPFPPSHTLPIAALVSLPTSDGHLLEFDPLQTSPGQLDALDGITDSAKKGAREEMGRLARLAVERWKIA